MVEPSLALLHSRTAGLPVGLTSCTFAWRSLIGPVAWPSFRLCFTWLSFLFYFMSFFPPLIEITFKLYLHKIYFTLESLTVGK